MNDKVKLLVNTLPLIIVPLITERKNSKNIQMLKISQEKL